MSNRVIEIKVYDKDGGFEGSDDLIASSARLRTSHCTCFDKDEGGDASCVKSGCVEEVWDSSKRRRQRHGVH